MSTRIVANAICYGRSVRHLVWLPLLAACGSLSFGDLPRPALTLYADPSGDGACTSSFAVDATGAVWSGRSCGADVRPLTTTTRADSATIADLSSRFDALLTLSDDADCEAPTLNGARYRFRRTVPGTETWPSKQFCEPGVDAAALDLSDRIQRLARGAP
jgi:hypothetical protein